MPAVHPSGNSANCLSANGRQFTFAVGENIDAMDYEIGELVEVTYEGSLTKENAVAEGIDYQ